MNRPAMRNQYGEMYTGIPNGRAMTIPGWGSRCGAGRSGVIPATLTMLRDEGFTGVVKRGRANRGVGQSGAVVGGLPYAPFRGLPADSAGTSVRPGHGAGDGGRRTAPTGDLAVPGRRLHDLPAALPVPGDRPAARAAEPR